MIRLPFGARRRAEKTTSRRGLKVGVVAGAATIALGATMIAPVGDANAGQSILGIDIPSSSGMKNNPANFLGKIVGGAVNNGVSQEIANQWRIEICGSSKKMTSDDGKAIADCVKSTGTGIAMVVPGSIELTPKAVYDPLQKGSMSLNDLLKWLGLGGFPTLKGADTPFGAATVIGDGFQFALAQTGGKATAISYLPLSLATAGASGGRTAISFAVIGMANAWTTDNTPIKVLDSTIITLPGIKSVSCFGMLTAAYAEDAGACVNVLGTFDSKLDLTKKLPELQFALTNPVGAFMNPQDVFTEFIGQVFGSQGFNPATLFTDDIARLSLGGDNLLSVTSDYGLQQIGGAAKGAIALNWMGATVYLLPPAAVNGKKSANLFGLPQFNFNNVGLSDLSNIIPSVKTGQFKTPVFGTNLDGIDTGSLTSGLTSTATNRSVPNGTSDYSLTGGAKKRATEPVIDAPVVDLTTSSSSTSSTSSTSSNTELAPIG
ncbi:MAG: hypothetical protein WAW85_14635 [Gordonia sp. (in: high G+C Gram-positive bacteria)]|uniref:hypothetical protein n=1 Tax=Gordonia sp. (in: high G+C Gram-positive bacteria) TaxID=84139 RepID=UPI003BB4A978